MKCIACGCTQERACQISSPAGPCGCAWVQINPPKCSACFDEDGLPFAVGAEEGGLFGVEHCPASDVPAPHVPIYAAEDVCYCARCRMELAA